MKKILLSLALMALATRCVHHDDFDIVGVVVDYEPCQSAYEVGYAISLRSPDTIGGRYMTQQGEWKENVVVVYGADRLLHPNDSIKGSIYLDPGFSKATCIYHFDRDVPEAVFTKLKKL